MLAAVLGLGRLERLECLLDAATVFVRSSLDVLVGDVGLTHLAMGVHAATRQAHARYLRSKVRVWRQRGPSRVAGATHRELWACPAGEAPTCVFAQTLI